MSTDSVVLVEFAATLTHPDMTRLRDTYGVALNRPVPDRAYLERIPASQLDPLRDDFLVTSAQPLTVAAKLGPGIAGAVVESLFSAAVFAGADPAVVASDISAAGAMDVAVLDDRDIGGEARIQFGVTNIADLDPVAALPDVVWVDVVPPLTALSTPDASVIQSGSPTKSSIWDRGLHGEGQVIGMIDEGPLDLQHCFFRDDPPTPGPNHRKVLDHRNLTGPSDDHACFVAGIAAGDELGNSGNHPDRGGAWAAKLVVGTFDGLIANGLLNELFEAARKGAVIHNNSWNERQTGLRGTYTQKAADVDLYSWLNEEHLVLGGIGNAFETDPNGALIPGDVSPPGAAKNALCVSAAKAAPDQMELGEGIFGPTADRRRKPDLVAVGCGTRSAQRSTTNAASCNTVPIPCGTSMATPGAAAAAALVRQYFIEGWYPSGAKQPKNALTPTGALMKAVLLNSTVHMTGQLTHDKYPNDFEGWGLIQLDRTLFFTGSARSLVVWDVRIESGIEAGKKGTHSFKLADRDQQLKITLVFTDRPPVDSKAFAAPVVNNLDLVVTAPDRTVYCGNDLTPAGVSVPNGKKADTLNTVEMVIVNNPPRGTWTIDVVATSLQTQRQGYALVVTGGKLKSLLAKKAP